MLSAAQSLPQSDPRSARPPVHGNGDHQQGDRRSRGALARSRQSANFYRSPPPLQRQVSCVTYEQAMCFSMIKC